MSYIGTAFTAEVANAGAINKLLQVQLRHPHTISMFSHQRCRALVPRVPLFFES
jgi:hypothetical protein